ncbi:uncharacterized protein [Eurosta solidaginis]|uniref:uncharacterized protein n=1 Tax=Eurosta solidaginis TaxID=178769 RepID=UPI003531323B
MPKQLIAIPPLSILIFLTSSCLVAGQVISSGQCRTDITYLSKVDFKALQGSWYMQMRYKLKHDGNYRCQKTDYKLGPNNEHLVTNSEIRNKGGSERFTKGKLTFLKDGQYTIEYDDPSAIPFKYKTLSLDSTKYVIIYICKNLPNNKHAELVSIHTRERGPSKEVKRDVKLAIAALKDQKINTRALKPVTQKKCTN